MLSPERGCARRTCGPERGPSRFVEVRLQETVDREPFAPCFLGSLAMAMSMSMSMPGRTPTLHLLSMPAPCRQLVLGGMGARRAATVLEQRPGVRAMVQRRRRQVGSGGKSKVRLEAKRANAGNAHASLRRRSATSSKVTSVVVNRLGRTDASADEIVRGGVDPHWRAA